MNVDVDHYTDNRLANVDLNRDQVNFANANLDFELTPGTRHDTSNPVLAASEQNLFETNARIRNRIRDADLENIDETGFQAGFDASIEDVNSTRIYFNLLPLPMIPPFLITYNPPPIPPRVIL